MYKIFAVLLFGITLQLNAQQNDSIRLSSPLSAEPEYSEPPGWIKVYSKQFMGFIDSEGVEVVSPIYDEIGPFDRICPGWAEVVKDGLTGMIDREGNLVVPCQYDYIDRVGIFREDWLMVRRSGLYGFIDLSGREVVDVVYDEIQPPNMPAEMAQHEKQ